MIPLQMNAGGKYIFVQIMTDEQRDIEENIAGHFDALCVCPWIPVVCAVRFSIKEKLVINLSRK